MRFYNPYKAHNGALIPDPMMSYTNISNLSKIVWAKLVQYSGENGICYPSQKRLAKDTATSLKSIQRVIKELKDEGFIETTQNEGVTYYHFIRHEILKNDKKPPLKNGGMLPSKMGVHNKVVNKNLKTLTKKTKAKKGRRTKAPGEALPVYIPFIEMIPEHLSTDKEFIESWIMFVEERETSKKHPPVTYNAAKVNLKQLSEFSADKATELVLRAVARGYRGIVYPTDKGEINGSHKQAGREAEEGKYSNVATVQA